jgi:pimeloyl-[acyl-carrier protein] methyl ester esterase
MALPIVLLPGLNGTARLLENVRARLAAKRPAAIIDYPTHEKLGYSELSELVRGRLSEARFIVLGESFSGPIAIELAASMPDRVAGLILAVSFARNPLPVGASLARGWLSLKMPRPRWAMAAGLMGTQGTPELRQALGQTLSTVPQGVVAFRVGEATRVDKRVRLKEVVCPILYISGQRDWLLGRGPMQEVVRIARHAKVAEIDGPHMLLATHAAEAADAIESFCEGLS